MFRRIMVCALAVLSLGSVVLANGKFMPAVGYPKTPEVPAQRAMIVHRDGVETLTVESTADSESLDLGWVLPLPAEPTEVAVADGGLLKSLSMSLRPDVTHETTRLWQLPVLLLIVVWAYVLLRATRKQHLYVRLVVTLGLIALFAMFLLPTLGRQARYAGLDMGPGAAVRVASQQRVGNYDVTVLRADSADALDDWMTANGFAALPQADRDVANAYIADGWCFLLAKLVRAQGGLSTPHPLQATFPSASPVYPMRMTALADSTTDVELFVVAEKAASHPKLEVIARDTFKGGFVLEDFPDLMAVWVKGVDTAESEGRSTLAEQNGRAYWAAETELAIGHPDAVRAMWNGCVVTRLVGRLQPRDMTADLTLSLADAAPFRKHVYSQLGRRDRTGLLMTWAGLMPALGIAAMIGGLLRRGTVTKCALGAVILASAAGPIAFYLTAPTVKVSEVSGTTMLMADRTLHYVFAPNMLRDTPSLLTDQEVLTHYREVGAAVNPYTGRAVVLERSPGNIMVRQVGGIRVLCFYDADAVEHMVPIPSGQP